MPVSAGDTLLLTRATGDTPHLWAFLWGPTGAANAFLAVYLTTLRAHYDRTCIILPGEHPFIQHETVVAYNNAAVDGREAGGAAPGRYREAEAAGQPGVAGTSSPGLFASPRTPHAIVAMARDEFGASP